MDVQKGTAELGIAKGIKIQSSILQKIQQLTMSGRDFSGSSAVLDICRAVCVPDRSGATIAMSIREIESTSEKLVNVWKINESVVVIGETSNSMTEHFAKKSNIDHTVGHLDELYGDKYVVYTFRRSSIPKSFRRSILYDEIGFSVDLALEIAQTCKFFLNNRKGCVLAIEMRSGSESIVLFLVSCILSYCKFYWSSETALNALSSSNPLGYVFPNSGTVLRYVRYFDQANSLRSTARFPQMVLNQAIVTTIPTILSSENFRPVLYIKSKHGESVFSLEKCYRDDDFLIFSNLDAEISDDAKISLYFEQEKKQYHVLDLSFNTMFYQQGLYRFGRSEIETSLPQDSIYRFFKEDFYIDIVLIENRDRMTRGSLPRIGIMETMRTVTEHFFSDYDESRVSALIARGYSDTLSTFCAQMHLSESDSERLCRMLIETGHKVLLSRPHAEVIVDDGPEMVQSKEPQPSSVAVDYSMLYAGIDDLEAGDLCLLEDPPIRRGAMGRRRSILFSKRSEDLVAQEGICARRPLHWATIRHVEGTFFSEMADTDSVIDYELFERLFCDSGSEALEVETGLGRESPIDPRRLFLASLAIKSLELNRITPENLGEILRNRPHSLSYEDLSNIARALPENEDEAGALSTCPRDELGPTEAAMAKLSEIPEVASVVEILRFERSFFEEMDVQQRVIEETSSLLSRILGCWDFKRTLKMVLDIGNTINCRYGKSRKLSEGFRIESLSLLTSYRGKDGKLLIEFVLRTMEQNGTDSAGLEEWLKGVHSAKNEDIQAVRAKINELVSKYKEVSGMCNSLECYDTERYRKFAAYVYRRLSAVSAEYRECVEKCRILKAKLGEEEKTPIAHIFALISDFLLAVRAERLCQRDTG